MNSSTLTNKEIENSILKKIASNIGKKYSSELDLGLFLPENVEVKSYTFNYARDLVAVFGLNKESKQETVIAFYTVQ